MLGGAGLRAEEERDPLAAVIRIELLLPRLLRSGDGRRLHRLARGGGVADKEGDAAADKHGKLGGEQREEPAVVVPVPLGQ